MLNKLYYNILHITITALWLNKPFVKLQRTEYETLIPLPCKYLIVPLEPWKLKDYSIFQMFYMSQFLENGTTRKQSSQEPVTQLDFSERPIKSAQIWYVGPKLGPQICATFSSSMQCNSIQLWTWFGFFLFQCLGSFLEGSISESSLFNPGKLENSFLSCRHSMNKEFSATNTAKPLSRRQAALRLLSTVMDPSSRNLRVFFFFGCKGDRIGLEHWII